ncbi:GroES-like protein [Jaminaea rosea]|uniref:GroES-like protein n=1 Tax=Jaminaea rosea TaxID=1569628 RepID=A0A316UJS8_9BASI|nr:GroES-like protein [Jaminaea rosea]PWN25479.1 GroES-like protein [Jaminaea rosea]
MSSTQTFPKTMKAGVLESYEKGFQYVADHNVPEVGPDDVLVQVKAAGYCHTDLQVSEGVYSGAGAKPGMIGSHEPAGIVAKLGANAEKRGLLKVGDRVGSINTYHPCFKCQPCRNQGQQLCENVGGMLGVSGGKDAPKGKDGGFSEYMIADDQVLKKVPDNIPFAEAAPLFCAGATTYGAILASGAKSGEWVAHIGLGGLGLLGIQYSKALGHKVVAIDNRKEAIQMAKEQIPNHLQADEYVLIDSEDAQKKCTEELGGKFYDSNPGVDKVVINAEARHLVAFAQDFLRIGGVLVDVGLPSDGPLEVSPFPLSFKEQTVKGRLICTPDQSQDMVNLHSKNGCRTPIEQTFNIKDIHECQKRYKAKDLKGRLVVVFE